MDVRSTLVVLLGAALYASQAASQAHAQTTPGPSDQVVTPLKRQAPSASAAASAMQRSLASGPRLAPPPSAPPTAAAVSAGAPIAAAIALPTVVVTITSIKPLDATFDPANAQARISIAGVVQTVERSQRDGPPTWVARKSVNGGKIAIRVDVFDGPPGDRPIDFNRAADRRHHDFLVDTSSCRILGFSGNPTCGAAIVRSGTKARRAEVAITVDVVR